MFIVILWEKILQTSRLLILYDSVEAKKNRKPAKLQFAIQTSEDCLLGYVALTKLVEGGRGGRLGMLGLGEFERVMSTREAREGL